MDEEDYPELLKRTHHETDALFDERVDRWAARRNAIAEELALDPSLIATRSQIESIATNEDKGLAALMNWQRNLLTR
jgi:ribonuclease D